MEKMREIEYTPEFKDIIAQNPGSLKSFLKLEKEISESDPNPESENEKTFEDGDVKVTPLYEKISKKRDVVIRDIHLTNYLKVEIGDQKFFVKTVPGYITRPEASTGVDEFRANKKAAEILKDIPGVKMIDAELGYRDTERNKTYFVSKWMDLPPIFEYVYKKGYLETENLRMREREVARLLEKNNLRDTHTQNMFYDEKTDTIYLYDVFDSSPKE